MGSVSTMQHSEITTIDAAENKPIQRKIFWIIVSFGIGLPWVVGIGVKLFLMAFGKPTIPFTYFINPLLPIYSIWLGLPYIVLAVFCRKIIPQSVTSVLTGLIFGSIGPVLVYIAIFWAFDPLYFVFPIWVFYVPLFVPGLLFGFWIADKYLTRKPDDNV